ncbi:MAG: acyltransferase [Clostridia bacterium]
MSPTPESLEHKPAERLEIGVLYGFRALMVLFVANFHLWQQSWLPQYFSLFGAAVDCDYFTRTGYLFVDGMLLLSGFLLYLPYVRRAAEGTPVPSVRRFYLNRLIRVLPSYLLAVFVALFCFALPNGRYTSIAAMTKDLLAHLTFTQTFWIETYYFTPLNGVLWTVAVEMHFYLLFPLLVYLADKKPVATLGLMAAAAWVYRAIVYYRIPNTAIYINQLPAFLDVYALGMLGAIAYMKLRIWAQHAKRSERAWLSAAALAVFIGSIGVLLALLRVQSTASLGGVEPLRLSQLALRLPLALTLIVCMLSATQMPQALRWLLDNRLMRFLSTISFHFYIWHQILAVEIATKWFPNTLHVDFGLQRAYTLLMYSVSILVAMLATFGWEQPMAKLANFGINKQRRKKLL